MKSLYFIAIVPPERIEKEIEDIKLYFSKNYNSKASLRAPAHITLNMPFLWDDFREIRLYNELHNFIKNKEKFSVNLNGFDVFVPKVIFVNVEANKNLNFLQKKLFDIFQLRLNLIDDYSRKNEFHPHITVAFKDLKKDSFYKAYEEFKNKEFKNSFLVDHITLLKHNGKKWEIWKNFYFH